MANRLWLESTPKHAKMGRAYGYIMRVFAKAPQISSLSAMSTRSSLYETRRLHCWMSHRSRSSPLSARPTRRFSAACTTCSSWSTDFLPLTGDSLFWELLYKRANFFSIVANAVPFLSLPACRWQTRRACFMLGRRPHWNSTHRDGMSPLRWQESLLSALVASFLFREQPRPSHPSAFFLPGTSEEPLGLEWSPPEEPSRSRLDEWFLPGRLHINCLEMLE